MNDEYIILEENNNKIKVFPILKCQIDNINYLFYQTINKDIYVSILTNTNELIPVPEEMLPILDKYYEDTIKKLSNR